MNILLIEDDDLQAEWICGELKKIFKQKPNVISTESEFRSRFKEIEKTPPDVVVIDVMLRWALPSPTIPKRPDDAKNLHTAGFRCRELLAKADSTKRIPVILYTVFDAEDHVDRIQELGDSVAYLRKDSDSKPLIRLIQQVTRKH